MRKIGGGPEGLLAVIEKGLKPETPEWAALRPVSQEQVNLTVNLYDNKPSRGTEDSWHELAGTYQQGARDLLAAVLDEDRETALQMCQDLKSQCNACHQQHRPPRRGPGPGRGADGPGGPRRP
jgi:hypothetical protein